MRMGLINDDMDEDEKQRYVTLAFFVYYVDDAGLACINDLIFDRYGAPVMIIENGQPRQQRRGELYFEAAMGIANEVGHGTPIDKQSPCGRELEFLGVDLDFHEAMRRLSAEKRKDYSALVTRVVAGDRLVNKAKVVCKDRFNSMVHKLLHACEVIPLMRQHLHYTRKALKVANSIDASEVVFGALVTEELTWCLAQLAKSAEEGIPFATRFEFPSSSSTTLIRYADASRELRNPSESGYGAWCVMGTEFFFTEGRWSEEEVLSYSINVLETHVKDFFGVTMIELLRRRGHEITHTLAFTDNSTAECTAEFGRTTTDGLNELNLRRQNELLRLGVHEATERVASVDNDIADKLSRGQVAQALAIAKRMGLSITRVGVEDSRRSMHGIPTTWDAQQPPTRRVC